ncbi:MAG: transglycosylase domain-containing protein [Clostridia bacterium]|nr:transglycosylase domain-containing protein [Deltaproteobacteria bacterium]
MRTIVGVVTLLVVFVAVSASAFARLNAAARAPIDRVGPPPASAYSSAFTAAVWAQVERVKPVAVDRETSLLRGYLNAGTGSGARVRIRGFLLSSVAATTLGYGHASFIDVLELIIASNMLRLRSTPDDLAALYGARVVYAPHLAGVEAAARQLFGKPPALLDGSEAALLAELAWARDRCNVERLYDRREALLGRMRSLDLEPTPVAQAAAIIDGSSSAPSPMVLGSLCNIER